MSRSSGHRKSQSTSALSVIAASSSRTRSKQPDLPPVPSHPSHLSRPSSSTRPPAPLRDDARGKKRSLESVSEDQHAGSSRAAVLNDRRSSIILAPQGEASTPPLPDIAELHRASENRRRKLSNEKGAAVRKPDENEAFVEKVRGWLKDIMSLRSSPRRRLAGLENFEKLLIGCCLDEDLRRTALPSLFKLKVHSLLLSLLTRHASTLIARAHSTGHSALGPSDEVVLPLIPELTLAITTLQGLCLIDATAKAACGDPWTLEMFIDLLLLLRTQSPARSGDKTVVYCVLELMLAVLVDSPANSRTFEKLQGLEAVMRVLKGTGVIKDVRMKCIEFIYFWLQPEEAVAGQRSASSSSSTSTSSVESAPYPPSPLGSSTSSTSSHLSTPSFSSSHLSPMATPDAAGKYALPRSPSGWKDIDIPFVPQTPRKAPQPTLGYLTPSTRRVSAGGKSTPGLPTVPGSPVVDFSIPEEREDGTPKATPSSNGNAGLGLGLPQVDTVKSPTIKRDVTAIRLSAITDSPDPFDSTLLSPRKTPCKSGGLSRSSTQPSLTIIQSSPQHGRKASASRRMSKSPLAAHCSTPDSPPPVPPSPLRNTTSQRPGDAPEPKSKMRHSKTQSLSLAALAGDSSSALPSSSMAPPLPPVPSARAASRMRHSRTQSHLSSLAPSDNITPPPPLPGLPSIPRHRLQPSRTSMSLADPPSRQSSGSSAGSNDTMKRVPMDPPRSSRPSMPPPSLPASGVDRTPSKAKRAFPAELTKGLPPSASSPALSALANTTAGSGALLARKRVPSSSMDRQDGGQVKLRSMEEKKEMLGAWLGNVDALVQGVEKVSFWGSGAGRT